MDNCGDAGGDPDRADETARMIKIVVSACLLGSPVRYNGADKRSDHPVLRRWIEEGRVVSACPEMLGGLGTPRPPAEILGDRVVARDGRDVTAAFELGARETASIANAHEVRVAILKEGSPSCGSTFVYDGTFTGVRLPGAGVTAALLRSRGIAVFSEEQLDEADAYVRALETEGSRTAGT
jgi:uncharacterized protein YbbK (DUF523 family)